MRSLKGWQRFEPLKLIKPGKILSYSDKFFYKKKKFNVL